MTQLKPHELARIEQSRRRAERVKRFVELMADGSTIRAAAKSMGIGESTALAYWAEIKRSLEQ